MSFLYNLNDSFDYQFESKYRTTADYYYIEKLLIPPFKHYCYNRNYNCFIKKPTLSNWSELDNINVFPVYDEKLPEVAKIPIIDDLVSGESVIGNACSVIGPFNEIEYSTNIRFINPNIKAPKEDPQHIKSIFRTYFKKQLNVYSTYASSTYNSGNLLSTKYDKEKDLTSPTCVDLFLRVDEKVPYDAIGGSMVNNADEKIERITYGSENYKEISAKLKVLREKFNHRGMSYNLMGAVEVPLTDLETYPILGPNSIEHKPFKRLHIISWYVTGTYLNVSEDRITCRLLPFTFRIAFRRTMIAKTKKNKKEIDTDSMEEIDCNIECEDVIPGYMFVECAEALKKYYGTMYSYQDRYISPLFEKAKYGEKGTVPEGLTPIQAMFLEGLSISTGKYEKPKELWQIFGNLEPQQDIWYSLSDLKEKRTISEPLKEFIRLSSIRLYLESIVDKSKASINSSPPNKKIITCIPKTDQESDEKQKRNSDCDDCLEEPKRPRFQ